MLSQFMCTCPNNLGVTCIGRHHGTSNYQVGRLESKLSNYSINYLNSTTKTQKRVPIMDAINISTGATYFSAESEKANAIPLYCLPDKKATHGLPQQVEEKLREIEASTMSDQEKGEEKRKLENWRSKAVAQYSEDIVSNKIFKIAKERDEECLVLTGYKSETYLCTVRDRAKAMRSSPIDSLNEAEKDVADLLGLDLDVTQVLADIIAELPNNNLSHSDLKNNDALKKAIKRAMFGKKLMDALEKAVKKTCTSAPLDENTLKNICQYSTYVHQVEKASLEVDHLTVFPHQKKILQVETKSVMNNPLSKLMEGASQCNKFCELVSKCHGDILFPDYTFIKVVALPMIENQSKLVSKPGTSTQPPCDNCKSYIWTQKELENVEAWMESNILTSPAGPQTPTEYKDLFNRLVGFMSLSSLKGQYFHSKEEANTAFDEAIAGGDARITTEGLSHEQQRELTSEILRKKVETIKLLDIKGKPLSHIDTFILWNSEQLTLILQNPDRVCISSDFGTGKSLLLKYMAKRKAEELMQLGRADKSVFVSLGATKRYIYGEKWQNDTLYDIATRMEFTNSGVVYYSTKDLVDKFTTEEERDWTLNLEEINLDISAGENIAKCAQDLINMATTQNEMNEVGDNEGNEKSIEDLANRLKTQLDKFESEYDEDIQYSELSSEEQEEIRKEKDDEDIQYSELSSEEQDLLQEQIREEKEQEMLTYLEEGEDDEDIQYSEISSEEQDILQEQIREELLLEYLEEGEDVLHPLLEKLRAKSITVDTIITRLILYYPSFSYFFDEVTFGNIDVFEFPHLTNIWNIITGSFWLALRPTDLFSNSQSEFNKQFTAFKTELEKNNVYFPTLAMSMRNTSKILQLANTVQDKQKIQSNPSSLPLNTISGTIPELFIFDKEEIYTGCVKHAIEEYRINNEPVVILIEFAGIPQLSASSIPEIDEICSSLDKTPCVVYLPDYIKVEEEKVKMFLKRPHGILITTPHLFNGCQAKYVITCEIGGNDLRSSIMRGRATSVLFTTNDHPQIEKLKKLCQIKRPHTMSGAV